MVVLCVGNRTLAGGVDSRANCEKWSNSWLLLWLLAVGVGVCSSGCGVLVRERDALLVWRRVGVVFGAALDDVVVVILLLDLGVYLLWGFFSFFGFNCCGSSVSVVEVGFFGDARFCLFIWSFPSMKK